MIAGADNSELKGALAREQFRIRRGPEKTVSTHPENEVTRGNRDSILLVSIGWKKATVGLENAEIECNRMHRGVVFVPRATLDFGDSRLATI